jgi:hypothetical protein
MGEGFERLVIEIGLLCPNEFTVWSDADDLGSRYCEARRISYLLRYEIAMGYSAVWTRDRRSTVHSKASCPIIAHAFKIPGNF